MTMQPKCYNLVEDLQPQYSAFLAATGSARSVVPAPGDSILTVDLGDSLEVESLLHKLFSNQGLPGLAVERQDSVLEFISPDLEAISATACFLLEQLGSTAPAGENAQVANSVLIDRLSAAHATLVNRSRKGAMVVPGDALLMLDVQPAHQVGKLFNELEKDNPALVLVDIDPRRGRLSITGQANQLQALTA